MYQIQQYNIQLGDKVSRLKRGVPFIRHYSVYMGTNNYGQHLFAENNAQNGVKVVLADEFFRDASSIKVESTFKNWEQRKRAIAFAQQRIGQRYDLFNYNCEHFANEVTNGVSISKQVGIGLGIATLLVGGIVIKNLNNS